MTNIVEDEETMVLSSISLVTIQEKKMVGRWSYWIQRQLCTSKVEEQVLVEDTIKYKKFEWASVG